MAVVEERAQCYKALSDHAAQEISPEILLSPALHHDDQDQEEYDIQMMVNSEHFVENQCKSPLNFSRYENDADANSAVTVSEHFSLSLRPPDLNLNTETCKAHLH